MIKTEELTSLIDDFIIVAKGASYANKCYDWALAEKEITSNLFRIYDLLSEGFINYCNSRDNSDNNDDNDIFNEFIHKEWATLVDYCVGFQVDKLSDEDGCLADRLGAHTNVYYLQYDFEKLLIAMCKLKSKITQT
jgi:hypothetical protein